MEKFVLFSFFSIYYIIMAEAQNPDFISIDCGGIESYTDDLGIEWIPDTQIYGKAAQISVSNQTQKQYSTLRYFPEDDRKYCYALNVTTRTRYLIRATFLYGNFDKNSVFPKFDIFLGATHWSTIVISDPNRIEVREIIVLVTDPTISVCLSNATTGQPFFSTIELRKFNNSMYYTEYENQFYLSVSARINFGSVDADPVRYPDDPFDRIWTSDSLKKENYLVDVAPGTKKVSTTRSIYVNRNDRPPQKVMQTAVVGTNGTLNYRLTLDGFPGFGWAFSYFAEIEDLGPSQVRKFNFNLPGMPELSKALVNIQENAQGGYRLYEPGYRNLSLPFVLTFSFMKTGDSSQGPLLNAMEINKYLVINFGSVDANIINRLVSRYQQEEWAQEGGDPCLPVPWTWIKCNADPRPKIMEIKLSGKNLTGNLPSELTELTGLTELWLDGNSLTGPILEFTGLINLKNLHLENNQLSGGVPSSLADLQNLKSLYIQNNMLSGKIPNGLLHKNIIFKYDGNIGLQAEKDGGNHKKIIIGLTIGIPLLVVLLTGTYYLIMRRKQRSGNEVLGTISLPLQKVLLSNTDTVANTGHCFLLSEIREATRNFEKEIGSGGFGVVYYGKLKNETEIAVKVLTGNNSLQGEREFANEVSLLSRIHHRNLVSFLGYCQGDGMSILVYEYMHNGTLKEHLYGPLAKENSIRWIKRLEIAEDAAEGIRYLHTGCIPSVIHRDVKSSNILLDKNMRAKVSDFGLSKLTVEGVTHVSSMVRGTVGYLDPQYYLSQQLTEKSDVYSFGIILLELISGREAISNETFDTNSRNIVQWARTLIESGDIHKIIDPSLPNDFNIQSIWRIAEKALLCVQLEGRLRPSMSEVLKDIQEALMIEKETEAFREGYSDETSKVSSQFTSFHYNVDKSYVSVEDSSLQPEAR